VERLLADSRLAAELIGWEPRVGLEEGLERTIAWIQDHRRSYRAGEYAL
jgi:dTDP-glucose 4,6-dehydratase